MLWIGKERKEKEGIEEEDLIELNPLQLISMGKFLWPSAWYKQIVTQEYTVILSSTS